MEAVFVQVVQRPERKAVVKFAHKATHYFEYCEEVGCDIWDILGSIEGALFEPIGMWMPENLRKLGTGEYLQGVEVPLSFTGAIPEGFHIITLPACSMMVFRPSLDEEKFESAITNLLGVDEDLRSDSMGIGLMRTAPWLQLAPMGWSRLHRSKARTAGEQGLKTPLSPFLLWKLSVSAASVLYEQGLNGKRTNPSIRKLSPRSAPHTIAGEHVRRRIKTSKAIIGIADLSSFLPWAMRSTAISQVCTDIQRTFLTLQVDDEQLVVQVRTQCNKGGDQVFEQQLDLFPAESRHHIGVGVSTMTSYS